MFKTNPGPLYVLNVQLLQIELYVSYFDRIFAIYIYIKTITNSIKVTFEEV